MTHLFDLLVSFLNSNFFIALVTLAAGTTAFVIYFRQRRDRKREIANIILLEIQSAERKLAQIKSSLRKDPPVLPNDIRLLPTDNWRTSGYLFIRDFDRDEWDALTNFYNKCELIDETIKYSSASFWNDVEQIRANKQRIAADFSQEIVRQYSEDPTQDAALPAVLKEAVERFDELYMARQGYLTYTPDKVIYDAREHTDAIDHNLSQTAIGTKLKKLSNTNY